VRIWLIKTGEPLPIDGDDVRLLRMGILADYLVARGHEVTWWSSSFDHQRKRFRADGDASIVCSPGLRLILLKSIGYSGHISIRRYVEHLFTARRFSKAAPLLPEPDVILCSFPTIELAVAAGRYGKMHGVPVIVDVRDLWPDIFEEALPCCLRKAAPILLAPLRRQVRKALRQARAVIGTNKEFVAWGLRHAGREGTSLDRAFPLAYDATPPAPQAIEAARKTWQQRGSLKDGVFRVCFAGTFTSRVELDTVVHAALELQKRSVPVQVVLAGDGPDAGRLKTLAGGSPAVIFPGWLDRAELIVLMEQSHVGLLPYPNLPDFRANLPNKVFDYLAAGLPVVSSLPGLVSEFLETEACGVTYANRNSTALVAVLTKLAQDHSRLASMRHNAHRAFISRLRSQEVYGQLIDLVEQVVRVPPPFPPN